MHLRLAGVAAAASAPPSQRKSTRVKAPVAFPSPALKESKESKAPAQPSKRGRDDAGGDQAMRALKRQFREQQQAIAALQQQLLTNAQVLMGMGPAAAAAASGAGALALPPPAAAPPLPPALRGEMPAATKHALVGRIQRLSPDDLVRALEIAGVPEGCGELDLGALDPERLWRLDDFCEAAKRAKKPRRRPAAAKAAKASRKMLETASAATEQRLAAVRAARNAVAGASSDAEASSTAWDDDEEAASISAWDEWGTGASDTNEDGDALLADLGGEEEDFWTQ